MHRNILTIDTQKWWDWKDVCIAPLTILHNVTGDIAQGTGHMIYF